ncbi:hypothetical protein [Paenibacillus sp. 2TAB19]|uniref:hypothetical protein n=1 Tax=Paenibacillus sp. 2TAB19 TaxID=3233003 RepID=UPI003F978437
MRKSIQYVINDFKYCYKKNKLFLFGMWFIFLLALYDIYLGVHLAIQKEDISIYFTRIAEGITIGGFVILIYQSTFHEPREKAKQEEEVLQIQSEIINLDNSINKLLQENKTLKEMIKQTNNNQKILIGIVTEQTQGKQSKASRRSGNSR